MLQHLNVLLVVRGPKLNTVFEVRPHQCRVQGHDHFPTPAGHTIPDTSQDAVGFLGHLGTLPAHVQPSVNQHSQVLFHQAAFQALFPKPVALHGVVVTQVQDLALSLVEPHTIGLGPSIWPVQVPLSTLPPNLVPSANLLRAHSIPSSRSSIKILNKSGPKTEPWGTPLVTGCQLDLTPFTTTLWVQPSSQFFTHQRERCSSLIRRSSSWPSSGLTPTGPRTSYVGGPRAERSTPGGVSQEQSRAAVHASFDAAQDTVGWLGCKHTLPGHVELLINQHPQVLLLRVALNPFSAQPMFLLGIASTHVKDLALGLVELHEVRTGPPLKPVKVPLDGIPSLRRVNRTTQLGVVRKFAEGALNPTVHVTNKDIKQTAPVPILTPEEHHLSLVFTWTSNH
ncbi:hypothetical protein QYF61_018708 [Mycteria americana]|uniref:Uncharacterized protein n=1 Tax=Mycteria americana TaxID=33587 RepID=A0AAN7NLA6_MYCAM|nr:hypothetical protein QYF61_018708 [Mycteria americana]